MGWSCTTSMQLKRREESQASIEWHYHPSLHYRTVTPPQYVTQCTYTGAIISESETAAQVIGFCLLSCSIDSRKSGLYTSHMFLMRGKIQWEWSSRSFYLEQESSGKMHSDQAVCFVTEQTNSQTTYNQQEPAPLQSLSVNKATCGSFI